MSIEYYFIFKHNILSVKVRCPKCHIIGNLNIQTSSSSKKKFQISHPESIKIRKCQFGWTDESYDELEKIYEELKKERKTRVLM